MPNTIADGTRPPLQDLLHTVPSPLIVVLVGLAPSIAHLRRLLDVLTWRSSWQDSCLALAACWALCLFSDVVLRYALPLVVVCAAFASARSRRTTTASAPATEDTLHQTINDLSAIQVLLPSFSLPQSTLITLAPAVLLRTLALLYVPYLLMTRFIRLRVLVALALTLVLTWHARWALASRRALMRSSYLRRLVYRAYALLTGLPTPVSAVPASVSTLTSATQTEKTQAADASEKSASLRFLFTICENQRWWVGLDFTAALLPNERTSWSTAPPTLLPAAPPATFALPAPTTVFLPDPQSPDGKGRIKRTAVWRWEEDEWRVVVRTPVGAGDDAEKEGVKTERVERPLPSAVEEGAAAAAAGRIFSKMRQASLSGGIGGNGGEVGGSPERHSRSQSQVLPPHDEERDKDSDGSASHDEKDRDRSHDDEQDAEHEDSCTDADGWVYGDNKWEGLGARGGLGKYTRCRRWTRVAVLCERVERVEAGPVGVVRGSGSVSWEGNASVSSDGKVGERTRLASLDTIGANTNIGAGAVVSPVRPALPGSGTSGHARTASGGIGATDDDGSRLRQRLKAAVKGASAH